MGIAKVCDLPASPEWSRREKWSLLLIENWRELADKPLAEVAARQWWCANNQILDDLTALPPEDWCAVSYEELCRDPQATAERLCAFADWTWDEEVDGNLPLSRHTLTAPSPDKWRRHEAALGPILPQLEPITQRAAAALREQAPRAVPSPAPAIAVPALDCSSEHTNTFAELLEQLGISLAISTYQAGRLMLARAKDGELNTHFRDFTSPMGLAYENGLFAIGTAHDVQVFRAFREAAASIEPAGAHDAVFLPAMRFTTGDIRGHELAWSGRELWAVATRFSCLCTFNGEQNFVPRWRPSFITKLAAEDRCHLNGLVLEKGVPKYVTALGATDTPAGWREKKATGGVLIDVPSGEIVAQGLSMPHSPRLYEGKLWMLESGSGRVCIVDPATGKSEVFAELPGFTRGLDFRGPFAFVGLSQVRETAVFSGLPICEPDRKRRCGVWVLDLRTAQIVAFLRFTGGIQEVFAVNVLPARFPELLNEDHELIANSFYLPEDK